MNESQQQQLISRIQQALRRRDVPAWLFYGFHDIDPTAFRILNFPPNPHVTRRWFYLVPQQGSPRKLVHRIEASQLDHLPGAKEHYLRWQELRGGLGNMLKDVPRVAMQYSEMNAIPYLSRIDGGTVELIRSLDTEVVSSGDLVQEFEAVWSGAQLEQHRQTAGTLTRIVGDAFKYVQGRLAKGQQMSEFEVQELIMGRFSEEGLVTDHPPIVGVNQNSGDPHYCPDAQSSRTVQAGDLLLIDLWAKPDREEAVYADITWTGFYGADPPSKVSEVFEIVKSARDRGVELLQERFGGGQAVQGWEVDDAVRGVIKEAGYGDYFVHRTGHNLNQEVHGNGVNFDNLESHDTREVIPGIACTIEPGVYLPEFGIRSEINVHMGEGGVEVTTPPQTELLRLEV